MLLKATLSILFPLMLTASLSLNVYQELFPIALSTCDLKNHHLNTETPVLQAARPVLQAFWQSENAPICIKQQDDSFDALVKTVQNIGIFVDSVIEKSVVPTISPYITKMYNATVQGVVKLWDPFFFKQSLISIAGSIKACMPTPVKEAWNIAFAVPTVVNIPPKASTVFKLLCEWIISDYKAILRMLMEKAVEIFKLTCSTATTAIEHAKAILKNTALSLIKRVPKIATLIDQAIQCLVLAIMEFANATQQAAVQFISSIHNLAARPHKFLRYVRAKYGIVHFVQYFPGGNLECFGHLGIPASSSKEEIEQAFRKQSFEMNQNEIHDRVLNYDAKDGFMKLGQAHDDAIAYALLHQNHAEDLLSLPLVALIALLDAGITFAVLCISFAMYHLFMFGLFVAYKVLTAIQPDYPFLLPSLYVGFEMMIFMLHDIAPFRLGTQILTTLKIIKKHIPDPPQVPECFTLLGVPPGSTDNVIKKAYRRKAKVTHPDKFKNDPEVKQRQTEAMRILNQAKVDALAYVVPDPEEDPQEKRLNFVAHLYLVVALCCVALRLMPPAQ